MFQFKTITGVVYNSEVISSVKDLVTVKCLKEWIVTIKNSNSVFFVTRDHKVSYRSKLWGKNGRNIGVII